VLEIKNAKTLHPDALWPVIEAHASKMDIKTPPRHEEVLGFDSASISEAVKFAPGLERIRFV
jgi:hypothetical protein